MDGPGSPPLRVAHAVATANFAGVERYISYVAPALAARAVDVTVLGGDEHRMAEALRGSGVAHRPAPSVASVVRRLVGLRHVDVVHAHMTAAEIAAAIAGTASRSRLVVTRHFGATRGSSMWGRAAGRLAARAVDRQIAISQQVATAIEGPSVVLLNAVPSAEAGPHEEAVVLVAQRMEVEKQGALAIEAWARSGLVDKGWRMQFAGDGAQRGSLEQRARERGVAGSVEFVGMVDDLAARMDRAAIFLATTPGEAFGLSVAEAMAHGMAIAAAGAGGHLETAGAAVPESMFPPGDADAAAALLVRLAGDADLRREHGERHRSFQRRELSVDRHVDGLMAVYASLRSPRP